MRLVSLVRSWLVVAILLLAVPACAGPDAETGTEASTEADEIPENEYGLEVIDDKSLYLQTVAEDPSKELVDLEEVLSGILLDIRYATEDNFMREQLYPVAKAALRKSAAESLGEVQEDLRERGLELKVFDGYRPYEVTEKMWEPYKNPDFVADPAEGSRHNRGCAVDVTLVDSSTGEELPMPTGYDDFTEKAGHGYRDLPEEAIRNRDLLREVMESHGFVALTTEWWHYDCQDWERFELVDLPLDSVP
jgi:zinc D-Ala-D-Ala dipeptidase